MATNGFVNATEVGSGDEVRTGLTCGEVLAYGLHQHVTRDRER